MSAYRNFRDYHIEQLRDLEDAKVYLSVALDDYEITGDMEAFLLAVRDVAEAQGGMSKLAERVSLTREGLYKALSENGNPQLNTMGEILHGLGFRFSIEARETEYNSTSKSSNLHSTRPRRCAAFPSRWERQANGRNLARRLAGIGSV